MSSLYKLRKTTYEAFNISAERNGKEYYVSAIKYDFKGMSAKISCYPSNAICGFTTQGPWANILITRINGSQGLLAPLCKESI